MFFLSGIAILKGQHNQAGFCDFSKMDKNFQDENCKIFTKHEVFMHNYFLWTVAYFVGLQFTHLGQIPIMSKFVLDWKYMKNWPPVLWAIFAALIGFIIFIVIVLFKYYFQWDLQFRYPAWGFALAFFFWYKSRAASDVHIHHYVLAMLVLSFLGEQNWLVTATHGVFNGIMIEGASHYGYDPIWTYSQENE